MNILVSVLFCCAPILWAPFFFFFSNCRPAKQMIIMSDCNDTPGKPSRIFHSSHGYWIEKDIQQRNAADTHMLDVTPGWALTASDLVSCLWISLTTHISLPLRAERYGPTKSDGADVNRGHGLSVVRCIVGMGVVIALKPRAGNMKPGWHVSMCMCFVVQSPLLRGRPWEQPEQREAISGRDFDDVTDCWRTLGTASVQNTSYLTPRTFI